MKVDYKYVFIAVMSSLRSAVTVERFLWHFATPPPELNPFEKREYSRLVEIIRDYKYEIDDLLRDRRSHRDAKSLI